MVDETRHPTGTSTFAQVLRRHRIAAALSQEALAERAGLSTRAISDLERGVKTRPYPETVRLLADALDLDLPARTEMARAARPQATEPSIDLRRNLADTIPHPPTSLVGRDREVAAVESVLQETGTRLLTLTGPGGVGKTRLALACARRMVRHFPGGIVWVDFAPLDDPSLVLPSIALALDVRDEDQDSLTRIIRSRLDGQQMLLIFDNCEHLRDAIGESAKFLTSMPGPTLLATSQIPLQVDAERLISVDPLDLPDPDQSITLEDVRGIDAISLFVTRAKAVRPDFDLNGSNVGSVVRICRYLDGLPLAIELAAARMRVLTPIALAGLLEKQLDALGEGPADAPARQRRIESTIAWSYALLAPEHQQLLRRLGAFSGGCPMDAVASVAFEAPVGIVHLRMLENAHLVRRSAGPGEGDRFFLLETVRLFARTALEQSDEGDRIRERHARYFLALARKSEAGMRGRDERIWLDRLTADLPNLREAMNWGLDHHDAELALGIAVPLWRFWLARGVLREGSLWLERGLAVGNVSVTTQCRALGSAASLARLRGDFTSAERLGNELLEVASAAHHEWGVVTGLSVLGLINSCQGRLDAAAVLGEQALLLARDFGDTHVLALTHYRLADAYDERDWIRARAHYAEALRLWRTIDHGWGICGALLQLGVSEHRLGDPKRAVACYREELLLAMDMNDRSLIAAGLVCLGEAASLTNQLASAADLLGASHALNFALGGIRNRVAEQQYQSTLARVRDGLPPDEFRTHWEAASAQPVEHVVQEALTMADILQSEA